MNRNRQSSFVIVSTGLDDEIAVRVDPALVPWWDGGAGAVLENQRGSLNPVPRAQRSSLINLSLAKPPFEADFLLHDPCARGTGGPGTVFQDSALFREA